MSKNPASNLREFAHKPAISRLEKGGIRPELPGIAAKLRARQARKPDQQIKQRRPNAQMFGRRNLGD
jgi:hypothetical protein